MDTATAIKRFLEFVADNAAFKEHAVEYLQSIGTERTTAENVALLTPVAFGRTSRGVSSVHGANKYVFFNADGEVVRSGRLDENDAFRIALDNLSEYCEHAGFEILRKTSPEIEIVELTTGAGVDPKNVTIGPLSLWLAPPTAAGREVAKSYMRTLSKTP